MATNTPVVAPPIPVPNGDMQSIQQAVLAIKQNIEIKEHQAHGIRTQVYPKSTAAIQTQAAVNAVKATLP